MRLVLRIMIIVVAIIIMFELMSCCDTKVSDSRQYKTNVVYGNASGDTIYSAHTDNGSSDHVFWVQSSDGSIKAIAIHP